VIEAPARGERVIFRQTGAETQGTLLQFEYFANPGSGFLPKHVHLNQEERYQILSGTATYEIEDEVRTARAGEAVLIVPGTRHVNPWNDSDDFLHMRVDAWPSLGVEIFFETWYGLVRDRRRGHLNRHWVLNYRQGALTVGSIPTQTYNAFPPVWMQRLAIPFLSLVARAMCFRACYREYSGDGCDLLERNRRR
jgi:quercetin dioxygenase-like cupin family protein